MKAILFGSIGVFCDSSDIQRKAYNDAFAEAGLDWYWDAPLYEKLLLVPGGMARITRFAAEYDSNSDIDVASIHQRKTQLFAELLESHQQKIRCGVVRLMEEAKSRGIKTGWVTSTEEANQKALVRRSEGALSLSDFDVITHRNMVPKEKPDPAPYTMALSQLGIEAHEAVAIEDTAACMRSAVRAEIPCVVTPHRFSQDQDYYEAVSVVSALGDLESKATMLDGVRIVDQGGLVTTQALESLAVSV
ncbi:HAD-IA family hydrolase [bacterium]|nr:HAD-IA family hydrolase [bacterium]